MALCTRVWMIALRLTNAAVRRLRRLERIKPGYNEIPKNHNIFSFEASFL
jgi:hypothetical protein